MTYLLRVDGADVPFDDERSTLLDVLRSSGHVAVKDGCSPQGQCGCCTVLVDGAARVACVTPARRVVGREVRTLDGFEATDRARWGEAFAVTGASQCGFCTPGIIVRLAALEATGRTDRAAVDQALLAHLCRCTGWQTIHEAFDAALTGGEVGARDEAAAAARAAIEGGVAQAVGATVALGGGGFADDTAPDGCLVAVPDGAGDWVVADSLPEARRRARKVQGRRSPAAISHPLEVPDGPWSVRLRTTWVEPGYLEPDASWCEPGGEPASPLANGGAFGGKTASPAPAAARALADVHGRAVKVVLAREDVVRSGPKRPPVAAGIDESGRGRMRVVRTPGVAEAITAVAPGIEVEEVDVVGPPTSAAIRAAGWAEAAALLAAVRCEPTVTAPNGAVATAAVGDDGVHVAVRCGRPLDATVLRSYCIGAAHMALGWVWSEGIAVDGDGVPHDLTIRSFGILRARDMPPVTVTIEDDTGDPVNGSDAVFAAVAAAAWMSEGRPTDWPTRRGATNR